MEQETFVFKLTGNMANWRRFYTNTSSLSYYCPTRTNIMGILASILKMPRDSYYEQFNSDNLGIAVKIECPLKKMVHTLNYRSDKIGYTQIKLEIIMSKIGTSLQYMIYLSYKNEETKKLLETLKNKINKRDLGYGVYLGQRQFKGDIELVSVKKFILSEKLKHSNSTILVKNIKGTLDINNFEKRYVKDIMPLDFNSDRTIQRSEEVLCEFNGNKIEIIDGQLNNVYTDGKENISFL
ncbi:MAG: CRISPR-associated protein Cas5 [Nanoarchaeota archaeon]